VLEEQLVNLELLMMLSMVVIRTIGTYCNDKYVIPISKCQKYNIFFSLNAVESMVLKTGLTQSDPFPAVWTSSAGETLPFTIKLVVMTLW